MSKSICFVGLEAYPVLNPKKGSEYFGGEAVQQTLLCKAFVELGYEVSLVTLDYGQPDGEVIDGVKVFKSFRQDAGFPGIKFIYPRVYSLWKALGRADSDIYYQSCAGMLTGLVARYCRQNERRFIFRLAHDSDCIPGEQLIPNLRDTKIYEYGIRRADIIAAQGSRQVDLLSKNYGLNSIPVNMAVQPPAKPASEREVDILWVNNLRQFKRPDLVLALARMLPERQITMIGGPVAGYEELFDEIQLESQKIENLHFLGAVPYHEVNDYFAAANVFINTSDWEGFPNSFLQSWVRGVPVISFFDPDGLIVSEGLGSSPGDIDAMAAQISQMAIGSENRKEVSARCAEYATAHYSAVSVARDYEKLLIEG